MADEDRIRVRDVVQVGSRISWGAILGGAMVTIAIFFLLMGLGGAVGVTVSDNVESETIGMGALIWSIVSAIISLFVGGYVTSRFTVGESKAETALYGLIMWGVVSAVMVHFAAAGMQAGAVAMVGASQMQSSRAGSGQTDWQAQAQREGVPSETIAQWRAASTTPSAAATNEDATAIAWASFAGTLLCMLAAVGGAMAGAGPGVRLAARVVETRRERDDLGGHATT